MSLPNTAAQADLFDDAEAAYLSENTRYGCASTRYFSIDPVAPAVPAQLPGSMLAARPCTGSAKPLSYLRRTLAVRDWIATVGAKTAYIVPGSPWENGYCESFNARFRDELLSGEIFYTLKEAQIICQGEIL